MLFGFGSISKSGMTKNMAKTETLLLSQTLECESTFSSLSPRPAF
jgi:hypothetical protein